MKETIENQASPATDRASGSCAPVSCSTASPDKSDVNEIKVAVNNLVWMYAPATITLGEADAIALNILNMIINGKPTPPNK